MGNIKRNKHGPEWYIQRDLKQYLKDRGWIVEQTHGNRFQTGFPDLYVIHKRHGYRWIDCKNPGRYTFTQAQRIKWPIWSDAGIGIWILTAANQEQYDLLFHPPNWQQFWNPAWGDLPDIDALLDSLEE